MKNLIAVLICVLSIFGGTQVKAQGEVRGFVYDAASGEPILFTNVYLKEIQKGSVTNVDGFYSISNVKPGTYTLISTYLGYDTFSAEIQIKKNQITEQIIQLNEVSIGIDEIEVSAERTEKEQNVQVSKTKVTPREISRLPSLGGSPDLAQFMQVVPGVVFTGDQGGQIYIRGGTPVQNKVLLDGMTVYNPFHSIGLFSVFDMDIIRNVDVYAGGYNARYGNRISAVMDIKTRNGNRKEFEGKASASPFTSKLQIEGPLKKWEPGKGGSSYLFNSRVSYLDRTSPALYSYADSNGLPFSFADFYGKMNFSAPNGSNVSLFGFSFNDAVDFTNTTSYQWNALGGGTSFLLLPPNSSTTIQGNFSVSSYEINENQADANPRFSLINGFEGGLNFSYYPNNDEVQYGLEISGFKTEFSYQNSLGRIFEQIQYTTEIAGYVRYKKVFGRLVLDPSFRIQYYASLQETSLEPRLGAKYLITDWMRFKFAGGFYSQNLISARSDRDVVNLFYGFLTGPDNLPDEFNGREVNSRLQKARHLIGGFEFDLGSKAELNVEGYWKIFNQLTDINRNKIYSDNPVFQDKPDSLREDYIIETGDAYGVDFNFTYDNDAFYFYAVYSLSYVTRFNGNRTYFPHWDRRHNVNLLGSYRFGNNKTWEVSARWNLGSGFPFTRTQGFYELIDFQEDGLATDYTSENGQLGILYADLNAGRLPYYHRLDFSLKKRWKLNRKATLESTFSLINAYNRANVFYFDRVSYNRVNQLPIIPSLSISCTF